MTSEYLHRELKMELGDAVEIKLKQSANVMLLDPVNYDSYRKEQNFCYFGGYAKYSPIQLQVPYSGTWHVVIDLGGIPGTVEYTVNVIKKKM